MIGELSIRLDVLRPRYPEKIRMGRARSIQVAFTLFGAGSKTWLVPIDRLVCR